MSFKIYVKLLILENDWGKHFQTDTAIMFMVNIYFRHLQLREIWLMIDKTKGDEVLKMII